MPALNEAVESAGKDRGRMSTLLPEMPYLKCLKMLSWEDSYLL